MKLTDFEKKPFENAQRALKEHYNLQFDVQKMSYSQVRTMLQKVRGLIGESKSSQNFYESQQSPAYLKLIFMEQALSKQFATLGQNRPRIVVENEEVDKSQVILAAQDLVDSVQKMLEDVGQMQVKELPALVSSIESEIGVLESQSFNEQVSAQLDALSATLKESQVGLKDAVNALTGQEAGIGALPNSGLDDSMDDGTGDEMVDLNIEEPFPDGGDEDINAEIEEPEGPEASVGRPKR